MLQDYLQAYLPPSHADAYSQIQQMAQWLDVYLSKYPAQYINCMTSDSEFVAFIYHAIHHLIYLSILIFGLYPQSCWKHKMSTHPTCRQCMIISINAMILECKNMWYFLKKQQNN